MAIGVALIGVIGVGSIAAIIGAITDRGGRCAPRFCALTRPLMRHKRRVEVARIIVESRQRSSTSSLVPGGSNRAVPPA
jgi:hypothetical protein